MSRATTVKRARRSKRDPDKRFAVLGVIAVVAVLLIGYIAYTANSGLPWEGRDTYTVEVPNAERLIPSGDVRIGGIRVGQVLATDAASRPDRRVIARIKIALDPEVGPLPVDSTVQVRPASVLGLTYVDIDLGRSRESVPVDGTLPLRAARASSNITDLFEIFDRRSAAGFQSALGDLSSGFAGRGTALNASFLSTGRLLPPLTRVMDTLAAPRTNLVGFVQEADRATAAFAPVADDLAAAFVSAAATFGALARERVALGQAIDRAPGTESAVTTAFVRARPGLRSLQRLAVDLRPAARELPGTLRAVNPALRAGVAGLRPLPRLERPLRIAFTGLRTIGRADGSRGAVRKLGDLAEATKTAISALGPAQIHCNTLSLFFFGFAGTFGTQGTGQGPALASLFLSTLGATNEANQNGRPSSNVGLNPSPTMNAQECESGNEPWSGKQQLGSPDGLQPTTTRPSVPPPGVIERARDAGLLTDPEGLP